MPISLHTPAPSYTPIVTSKLPLSSSPKALCRYIKLIVVHEILLICLSGNSHCLSEKRYYSIVCIASVRYVQAEDCNTWLHETLST